MKDVTSQEIQTGTFVSVSINKEALENEQPKTITLLLKVVSIDGDFINVVANNYPEEIQRISIDSLAQQSPVIVMPDKEELYEVLEKTERYSGTDEEKKAAVITTMVNTYDKEVLRRQAATETEEAAQREESHTPRPDPDVTADTPDKTPAATSPPPAPIVDDGVVEISTDHPLISLNAFNSDPNDPYQQYVEKLVIGQLEGRIPVIPQHEAMRIAEVHEDDADVEANAIELLKKNLKLDGATDDIIKNFFFTKKTGEHQHELYFMSKSFADGNSLLRETAEWPIEGNMHPAADPAIDQKFKESLHHVGTSLIFGHDAMIRTFIPFDDLEDVSFATKKYQVDATESDFPCMTVKLNSGCRIEYSPVKTTIHDANDEGIRKSVHNLLSNSGWPNYKVGKKEAPADAPFTENELKTAMAFYMMGQEQVRLGKRAAPESILDNQTYDRLKVTLKAMTADQAKLHEFEEWRKKFATDLLKIPEPQSLFTRGPAPADANPTPAGGGGLSPAV